MPVRRGSCVNRDIFMIIKSAFSVLLQDLLDLKIKHMISEVESGFIDYGDKNTAK